jgi:hypothetical protein
MKRFFISLALILPFGLKAQTKVNCDKIQNENQSLKSEVAALQQDTIFLRSKLAYYDKLNSNVDYSISSFSSQFDIKVLSCRGDRGAQTVKLEFVVHHRKVNQKMVFGDYNSISSAYDEVGNKFTIKTMAVGTADGSIIIFPVIPTDIDVRGSIIFKGILGGTDKFRLVQVAVSSEDADGGQNKIEGKLDIRNIKIDW